MSLMNILAEALKSSAANAPTHYDRAVDHVTRDDLAGSVAAMFRDKNTPPYEQMVSQLFGNSNNFQRAGLLNQLIRAAGPALAAAVASGALKNVLAGGKAQVTPAEAANVTPEQVEGMIKEARVEQPAIADQLGKFYANNPGLVKAVGGAALLILLSKMKDRMNDGR
jgi:xanthine dehydrogenase iron-sulfur cluster and FAD-binding subunit A